MHIILRSGSLVYRSTRRIYDINILRHEHYSEENYLGDFHIGDDNGLEISTLKSF